MAPVVSSINFAPPPSAQKVSVSVPEPPLPSANGFPDNNRGPEPVNPELVEAKVGLHRKLIEDLNLTASERMPKEELRRLIAKLVSDYMRAKRILLSGGELEAFASEIVDELTGLGPIETLLKDPTIGGILINTHRNVYVERMGGLCLRRPPSRMKLISFVS